jgi:hypothetical protein
MEDKKTQDKIKLKEQRDKQLLEQIKAKLTPAEIKALKNSLK